jgi:hypothetical protein
MAPPRSDSLLWKRPPHIGGFEEVRGFGGVVAPLIAGFSLAATAQLVSADEPPPLTCVAVAAFTAAAVLLLFSVQFSFLMLRHSASPEERLAWQPEARIHPGRLGDERRRQAEDRLLSEAYYRRATFFFNLGLLMFFAGLGLTVVPEEWNAAWAVAVAIAAVAGLAEAWWVLTGGGLKWPGGPLLPREASQVGTVELPDLDEVSIAAITGKKSWITTEPPPLPAPAVTPKG